MLTTRQLIESCLLWLRDPFQDFHTPANLLIYVNTAVRDMAERSQCIQSWGFLPVVKDVHRYALPDDFLNAAIVGFESREQGWYPLGVEKDKAVASLAQWRYNDYGIGYPSQYAIGGNAVIERIIDTVTTIYDAGLTFEGNVNFLMFGVRKGDRILNVTDSSESIIINVTNTQVDHRGLYGGEDNEMAVDDEYRIVSASAPLKTINLAPPPGRTSDMGEEPLSLFYSREHKVISQQNIDDGNDEIELDLEFRPALEQRVCYYGSMAQYGKTNGQTRAFMADYEAEYKKAWPHVNKKMRDHANQWMRGMQRWPRSSTVSGTNTNLNHPYTSQRVY